MIERLFSPVGENFPPKLFFNGIQLSCNVKIVFTIILDFTNAIYSYYFYLIPNYCWSYPQLAIA